MLFNYFPLFFNEVFRVKLEKERKLNTGWKKGRQLLSVKDQCL